MYTVSVVEALRCCGLVSPTRDLEVFVGLHDIIGSLKYQKIWCQEAKNGSSMSLSDGQKSKTSSQNNIGSSDTKT